ncbi:MAG: hypothetical protein QM528_03775 [Phycisphaerales bacterium]|nr:hypothetical protein [Phycisphaerales bacterium]
MHPSIDRLAKLQEFLKERPHDAFLRHAMALEYIKQGNDTLAIAVLENLLQEQPQFVGSYYHLAKTHERLSHNEEAIKWYQAGIKIAQDVKDTHALNELRQAYADLLSE